MEVTQTLSDNNLAWYRACKEIIERCVAPDMYANARGLLDKAMQAATEPEAQPLRLNTGTPNYPISP